MTTTDDLFPLLLRVTEQALTLVTTQVTALADRLTNLEHTVSDVSGIESQALADLASAVEGLQGRLQPMSDALAAAQEALAAAQADDVADEEAKAALLAQVETNLSEAQDIANTIEGHASTINTLAQPATEPPPEG